MITVERKALYNLLRMHWLNDPEISVEPWQIEDYREQPLNVLFTRLQNYSIFLDPTSFKAYAEQCDSPEDFSDYLIADRKLNPGAQDQIFLLIFELWRRLLNEKPCFSVFCDEFDFLIYKYDCAQLDSPKAIQDAIAEFLKILNENIDAGIEPKEALKRISEYCANDFETFLYDYISEQIELDHQSYAHELLDGFLPFFGENKWFSLLRAKYAGQTNEKIANKLLTYVVENHVEEGDLEFNLELLSLLFLIGSPHLFRTLVKKSLPLLKTEENFQDLLHICIDYFQCMDEEKTEKQLQIILQKRVSISPSTPFNTNDENVKCFFEILNT